MLHDFLDIGSSLVVIAVFSYVVYLVSERADYTAIFITVFLIIYFLYLRFLYRRTFFVVTSRRVIKFVRPRLWKSLVKEARLENIKQISSHTRSVVNRFCNFGNIEFSLGTEEASFHVRGIPYHEEVALFISRITDHIHIYGPTDNFTPFIPRHIRRAGKTDGEDGSEDENVVG